MKFFLYIISSLVAIAGFAQFEPSYEMKAGIKINNTVLAKVAEKTITTYDVMKRLEINFNRSFPDLLNSVPSRYQFYMTGWQHALDELIDNELILIDSSKKELKISDAEIREEIENKYGPNVATTLQKMGVSHEEAIKTTKEEMIIQRMMYYFIKSKADQKITPSAIKNAYRIFTQENPPKEIWNYKVISIKSNDEKISNEVALKAYNLLKAKNEDPQQFETELKDIEKDNPNLKISISNLYSLTNKEISTSHQKVLSSLQNNSYSEIINQQSKSNDKIFRIFYLKDFEKKLPPTFDEIYNKLKEELTQKALIEESENYFSKLKKLYHVEKSSFINKDFVPFTIE